MQFDSIVNTVLREGNFDPESRTTDMRNFRTQANNEKARYRSEYPGDRPEWRKRERADVDGWTPPEKFLYVYLPTGKPLRAQDGRAYTFRVNNLTKAKAIAAERGGIVLQSGRTPPDISPETFIAYQAQSSKL